MAFLTCIFKNTDQADGFVKGIQIALEPSITELVTVDKRLVADDHAVVVVRTPGRPENKTVDFREVDASFSGEAARTWMPLAERLGVLNPFSREGLVAVFGMPDVPEVIAAAQALVQVCRKRGYGNHEISCDLRHHIFHPERFMKPAQWKSRTALSKALIAARPKRSPA